MKMPIVTTNKRRVKKYVIGGFGLFDTISGFFKRLLTSDTARRIGQAALIAGKDVGKEVGKTALDVGKSTAIEAGKRLANKVAAKILATPAATPLAAPTVASAPPAINPKNRETWNKLINGVTDGESADKVINFNNLLAGSGTRSTKASTKTSSKTSSKAITIQDLVRSLNSGTGLKLA